MTGALPILLGGTLGAGLVLAVSPFLWPGGAVGPRRGGGVGRALTERLALAGMGSVSPASFVVVALIAGLAVGFVMLALVPVVVLASAAGLAASALPFLALSWRARSRLRQHRALWPDVVDHLVSAVRAGVSLSDGLEALADTGPGTTRAAFAQFGRDYESTANFGLCLDRVKARLADPVADRILETLRMAREVGGTELVAVLRSLSDSLRREAAIRSEVEARQSWVVNAARLGAAAPWIVLLLLAGRPEAATAYNSAGGAALIAVGIVVTVVAYRVMLAIGRLPEEQRWFR